MTRPDADGPFPAWTPTSYLRDADAELVRCHTCAAVVARLDIAAHLDWHRGNQAQLDEVAARLADVSRALRAFGVEYLAPEGLTVLLDAAEQRLRAG